MPIPGGTVGRSPGRTEKAIRAKLQKGARATGEKFAQGWDIDSIEKRCTPPARLIVSAGWRHC